MIRTESWNVLTEHQRTVARPYIAERERERRHLVVYLSGAHAYGFPSPDSDLDIKCIHIAPTASIVGLDVVHDPPSRIDFVENVELDYGSNELAPVLRGAIKGNGNYLERVLGELALGGDQDLLSDARIAVRPLLSRRVSRHYGGFAASQLRAFDERPTAKRALYVLRTAATGRHLLAHGEVVTDVAQLTRFVPPDIAELIDVKRRAERQELSADQIAAWRPRLTAAIAEVDADVERSPLPAEPAPAAVAAIDTWLREVRRQSW